MGQGLLLTWQLRLDPTSRRRITVRTVLFPSYTQGDGAVVRPMNQLLNGDFSVLLFLCTAAPNINITLWVLFQIVDTT